MTISPGTRFGSYEVSESIGAGGMGEVWRARDTSLKRDVALKVLPAAFVADADRLARFRREAEILASLNHPNIATIHGLEQVDGQTVIVMELVEGPTLADRLERGPIPPDETIAIALQIVAALEAAHEKGVVHRDLKPANLKIRDDGTVKVLDFGISKPIDPTAISGGSAVATTPAVTQTGVILGTAAYMSPEQARGKFVDERTDIWAFGCLLFEMLTGQPVFGGEDVMLTLARVLDRDADLKSIPKTISPAVRHTIKLCLEKDPRRRIADIRDVRLALEGIFETALPETAAAEVARQPLWRRALVPAAALLLGGLLVGFTAWQRWPAPAPERSFRFEVSLDEGQRLRGVGRDAIAISPDGRRLAMNRTDGLFVRAMDELDARLLPNTENALTNPAFSPDGEWIVFWRNSDSLLQKVRVTGGAPVTLAQVTNPTGLFWAEDDRILVGQPDAILVVPANGGMPQVLIDSGESVYWDPQVLPDGSVLYTAYDGALGMIAVETPGSGDRTDLFRGERAVYLPTGHIATTDSDNPGTVSVRTFDLQTRIAGGPIPIQDNVWSANGKHQFAISREGTAAFVTGAPTEYSDAVLAIADGQGRVSRLDVSPARYRGPRISPDGTKVAVEIIGEDGRSGIWVYDLSGESAFRQLLGAGNNMRPLWTPDGERLTFASDREGVWGIYLQPMDGSAIAERLIVAEPDVEYWPDSWSPDMRTLAITRIQGTLSAIQVQRVATIAIDEQGKAAEPELLEDDDFGGAAFSPNGRWIAYRTNTPDIGGVPSQIQVQPFPRTGATYGITAQGGGSYPVWSADGRELIYRRPAAGAGDSIALVLGRVEVTSGQGFAWGNESQIEVEGGLAYFGFRDYDPLPDGEGMLLLMSTNPVSADEGRELTIEVATHWFDLVRERAPPSDR
jgi:serine/threonine-protein kinase